MNTDILFRISTYLHLRQLLKLTNVSKQFRELRNDESFLKLVSHDRILSCDSDLKTMIEQSETPEHWILSDICQQGNLALVRRFLEHRRISNGKMEYVLGQLMQHKNVNFSVLRLITPYFTGSYRKLCRDAITRDNLKLIKFISRRDHLNYNDLIQAAFSSKDKSIIRYVVERANDHNAIMREACQAGNVDIAKEMLEKGANNYDECMLNATYSGNLEIVRVMLSRGASNYRKCLGEALNIRNAEIFRLFYPRVRDTRKMYGGFLHDTLDQLKCENIHCSEVRGYIDIIATMTELAGLRDTLKTCKVLLGMDDLLYCNDHIEDYQYCFDTCAELIKMCFRDGGSNHNKVAKKLVEHGHTRVVVAIMRKGDTDYNEIAEIAARTNNIVVFEYIANNYSISYHLHCEVAIQFSCYEVLAVILSNGYLPESRLSIIAARNANIEILKLLLEYSCVDFEGIAIVACKLGRINMLDLVISHIHNLRKLVKCAVMCNRKKIIPYLVSRDKSCIGDVALYASKYGIPSILRYALKSELDFVELIKYGQANIIKLLIDENKVTYNEVLSVACCCNNIDLVKDIVDCCDKTVIRECLSVPHSRVIHEILNDML